MANELMYQLLISSCTAGAELAALLAWRKRRRIVSKSCRGRGNDGRKDIIVERAGCWWWFGCCYRFLIFIFIVRRVALIIIAGVISVAVATTSSSLGRR
jgi:hypothetical protein